MRYPKTIRGLAGPISIRTSDDLLSVKGAFGIAEYGPRQITLDSGLSPVAARSTLAHELVHFALFDSGSHNGMEKDVEERLCDALASAITAAGFMDALVTSD